jgi:5,10-methylenetetrahydromethanopterin reductase
VTVDVGLWIPAAWGPDEVAAVEAEGFDTAVFGDSPCVFPEPFARIGTAAAATSRIRLSTAAVNPLTRDVSAVTATIATLHAASGGRARLGLARGDSSLAAIGLPYPAPRAALEQFTREARAYLRGEVVDRDGFPSKLHWLDPALPPVEVEVSATGPRTVAGAAAVADRVTLAVGADLAHLGTSVERVRAAGPALPGAWLAVAVDDDGAVARASTRAAAGLLAHFSTMRDSPRDGLPPILRDACERIRPLFGTDRVRGGNRYDPAWLGALAEALDDAFLEWFTVAGPPTEVAQRLQALVGLGLSHLTLIVPAEQRTRFAREVLPALKEAAA